MDLLVVFIFGLSVGIVIYLAVRLGNWLQSKTQPLSAAVTTEPVADSPSSSTPVEPLVTPKKTGAEILREFLTMNTCQINFQEEQDSWAHYHFVFQGAYFESYSSTRNDEVLLYYHWAIAYTWENYNWIRDIAHQLSAQNKYIQVTYRYVAETDELDVCIRTGAINPTMDVLKYHFATIFHVAHDLYHAYDNREVMNEEERIETQRKRALFLRCQQYNEPIRIMANYKYLNANQLSVMQVLTSLFDSEQVEDLLSMTIVSERGTEQITQRDRIAHYDLFASIINKVENDIQASTIPVAITIDSTFFHYTFTLHLVDQTPENVFVRLTAMKVAYDHLQKTMPDQVYFPESVSCLLCYETSDEHSFEAFGRQMEQARQARRAGEELTDEQTSLLALTEGNLEYQILEGVKMANRGHYLQAIALLYPAYCRLTKNDNTFNDKRFRKSVEVASQLGVCYYHLNQVGKAYYYLHIAFKADHIVASYMYFKLLFHTHDLHLVNELSAEKQKMEYMLNEMANRPEGLDDEERKQYDSIQDYYLFLYRLHAEVMIREERYDSAYNDLNYLLQYEETKEYAQNRIDELDRTNPYLNCQ